MRCIPVASQSGKFQPVPVDGVSSFPERFLWRVSWAMFLSGSGLVTSAGNLWERLEVLFRTADVLGLAARLSGFMISLFKKRRVRPDAFYSPARIRAITDRDRLETAEPV
jgi:hypothetical protein